MIRFLTLALLVASCHESFNAGVSRGHDLLPVDGRNPVILLNDSPTDSWMGEYAMLLANSGGPKLVGIILVTGGVNDDPKKNNKGWVEMIDAAYKSGLRNVPDPTPSIAERLARPDSGIIMETDVSLNRSSGARLIVDESKRLSQPYRPLVVVAAARLTDVASAYLMDPSVAERVVVVASVGKLTSSASADMGNPNGEMDRWASHIVASKLRYIQVSARYDQQLEDSDNQGRNLPKNAFGLWMENKRQKIWKGSDGADAADQVAIAAVGIPGFVTVVVPVSVDTAADSDPTEGPPLRHDQAGNALLVSEISADAAINRFWQMLQDPTIFRASTDASVDTP